MTSAEFSQDQPVDREAVVANYTPEMTEARNALATRFLTVKEQAKAADAAGTLPERLAVHTYENGVTALDFGHLSEEVSEAMQQHQADRALGAMALDLDGVGLPGSELLTVTYDLDLVQAPEDPSLPTIEQPAIKVEWGNQSDGEHVSNSLSFFRDGYVETSSEVTRTEYVHPPDTPDVVRANAEPTIPQEVNVLPSLTQPAELADIQNTAAQLAGTAARYGIAV